MPRAFVLSGGASLGAIQVGMMLALDEAGIRPDFIVGTSAGAINGAWLAGHPEPGATQGLAEVWRGITRNSVFPMRPLLGLRGFLGRTDHLAPNHGLRKLVGDHVTFDRIEDATIPLHVVLTEAVSGEEVVRARGRSVDVVTASASIPGVLPPVRIDGVDYIDGGVSNNTPISVAHRLGADEIWVLPCGHACSLEHLPKSALAMVLHALALLVHGRLINDVAYYEPLTDLRVAPPLCPLDVSPADFSRADMLIDRALHSTREWLQRGQFDGSAIELLEPHHH
jgi:NTE family protein